MIIKANVPVEETIEEGAAREAGRVDGMEAVNETLEEQGKDAVVESLRLSRNDGNNHWEEAARRAGAHKLSDAKLNWDAHTELAYYQGYEAGSYERAEEIADAKPSKFVCLENTAADGSPLDPTIMTIDTEEEREAAKAEMGERDLTQLDVWIGEPGEAVRTGTKLFV